MGSKVAQPSVRRITSSGSTGTSTTAGSSKSTSGTGATGAVKPASGGSSGSTLSGSSVQYSGTSGSRTLNAQGYADGVDYSEKLMETGLSSSERAQLEKERQAKINAVYGGKEPTMINSNQTFSQNYTPSVGYNVGSSTGSTSSGVSGSSSSTGSSDYHGAAVDAAARGDWAAVEQALAARQAKINASGGNDYGISNQQILNQIRSLYGDSYSQLSSGVQDRVSLAAGEKLPFTNYAGQDGYIYKDRGWQEGVVYLDQAMEFARNGDLDAAYDALMRRGFKMADTGSTGGGTSQDQAYALIHQLYNQSPGALQTYQNKLNANSQALQEHQTIFGLGTRPELAYKQFMSADGRYWIIYDGQGRPSAAKPVSSQIGSGKTSYSQEEIDLMSRYYSGQGDRAELERQLHNLAVARTGTGRLVDSAGNWASGAAVPVSSADTWASLPDRNQNQDTAALWEILERIRAGEMIQNPVSVPTLPQQNTSLAGLLGGRDRDYTGILSGYGNYGGYGGYGGGYGDLSGYLQEMYRQNLESQLAQLRAAYEQNAANYKAHDDLIAQSYRNQQNQAAAQNDLQRMYMAEMGAMQGLNTGASGQLALAQSAAYQGALADLWAAEGQDRAANDLELRKLAAAYQGDMAAASAQSNSELAGALYSEYVRQIQAAETQRQRELEQARWLAQFQYQQEQDDWERQKWQAQWDYSQQADRQSTAYKIAAVMLENGIMPDSATLSAAGISGADAQALAQIYRGVNTVAGGSAVSGTVGGSKSGGSYGNGGLTTSQVKELQEYYGVTADGIWGSNSESAAGGLSADEAWKAYRTSFYYNPNEGLFTWSGRTYNDASAMIQDMRRANLTDEELKALRKKAGMFGVDLED